MSKNMYIYHGPRTIKKIKSESGTEDSHYPALYEISQEEVKRLAEKELNETEEMRTKGIKKLREFARNENIKCPDYLLLMMLRSNKFDTKKSQLKLKPFWKIREKTLDSLSKIDAETIRNIIDDTIFGILPYRDKFGRTIMYTRPNFNLDLYTADEVVTCGMAACMFLMSFPMTSICGITYIAECDCPSQWVLFRIISSIKFSLISFLKYFPIRFARMDIINEMFIMRWLVNTLYPFLPAKLVKRISFHGSDMRSLHKAYPVALLPTEFGGTLGPINNGFYREKLLDFILKLRAECPSQNHLLK